MRRDDAASLLQVLEGLHLPNGDGFVWIATDAMSRGRCAVKCLRCDDTPLPGSERRASESVAGKCT